MAYNPYPGGLVDSFPSYQRSLWSNDAALNSSYNRIGGAGASRGTPYAAALGKFNQENSNDLLSQFAPFLNRGEYPGASSAPTTADMEARAEAGRVAAAGTPWKGAGPGNMQFPPGGSGSPTGGTPSPAGGTPSPAQPWLYGNYSQTNDPSSPWYHDKGGYESYLKNEKQNSLNGTNPLMSSPTEMLTGKPAMGAATPLAPSAAPYGGSGGAGSGAAAYASESNPLGGPMTRPGMLTTDINPYPKGSQQWYDYETKNKQAENQYGRTMGSVGPAPGMGR